MGIENLDSFARRISRRAFLQQSAFGLGSIAFGSLSQASASEAGGVRGVLRNLHFPIRARRIIHLCMAGGPSHIDTFDPKPQLKKMHGQPFPESLTKGQQLAQLQNTTLKLFGSNATFKRLG